MNASGEHGPLPEGEGLRRAVQWLIEQGPVDPAGIAEAGRRFDLSPREQEFLRATFARDPEE